MQKISKYFLIVLSLLWVNSFAFASTLSLPEMHLELENVTESNESEFPINFKNISPEQRVSVIGNGVKNSTTREVIALICIKSESDKSCQQIQAASLIHKMLFTFGKKYSLSEAKKTFPAVLFDQGGWNWATKIRKLSTRKFYQLKEKLAKRNNLSFKVIEESTRDNMTRKFILNAKNDCRISFETDPEVYFRSELVFDTQFQVAQIFADHYDCPEQNLTLRINVEPESILSKHELKVQQKAADQCNLYGNCYQIQANYRPQWKASLSVMDQTGKMIVNLHQDSKLYYWLNEGQVIHNQEYIAHELLFSLLQDVSLK